MVKTKTKLQQIRRQYLEQILTRHGGSQGDEGDGVDAVLEIDEATEMSSNVSDDSGTETNGGDGDDEGGISVGNSCLNIKEHS